MLKLKNLSSLLDKNFKCVGINWMENYLQVEIMNGTEMCLTPWNHWLILRKTVILAAGNSWGFMGNMFVINVWRMGIIIKLTNGFYFVDNEYNNCNMKNVHIFSVWFSFCEINGNLFFFFLSIIFSRINILQYSWKKVNII